MKKIKIEKPFDWKPDWVYDEGVKSWIKPMKCNCCNSCWQIMNPKLLQQGIIKCIYNGPFEGYIKV